MEKLPELCSIQYGYAFDSACFTEDHAYLPLVRIRDVKRGYSETFYSGAYPSDYVIDNGSLLVGMDGEFNIARWKGGKALLNQRVCKITAREHVSEEYIRFALTKALKEIENRTAFVTVKHLSAKELNQLEIDIPDFETQVQISETLLKIENIISIRQQQLQKLDELVKARFIEMFNQEGSHVPLINLCQFINGDRGKNYPSSDDIVDSSVPFINAGHLKQNRICYDGMNFLTEEKYASLNSGKIQKNDILYCLRGSIGKKAKVDIENGAIASSLLILRPDTKKILPTFLLYSLEQPYVIEQMKRANNGSSQPNLSAQSVKEYDIILPTVARQKDFDAFVERASQSKAVIQKALDEAQLLFDSLMQKYFG